MSGRNLLLQTKRFTNLSLALLLFTTQLLFSAVAASSVGATQIPPPPPTYTYFCHRSNSATNPYQNVPFSQNYSEIDGVGQNDHSLHTGPVASTYEIAKQLKDNQQNWGDIIPPVPGVLPAGYNWTTEGQAIYNAGCEFDGGLKVNKMLDNDGNGSFELSSTTTNGLNTITNLGFRWGFEGETPQNFMSDELEEIAPGTYNVIESQVAGYEYVGWYTGNGNCTDKLGGTDYPVDVTVGSQTRHITLCNKKTTVRKGSITITKDADNGGSRKFGFEASWIDKSGDDFELKDGESNVSNNLNPGVTYTVDESDESGWYLHDIICSGGANVVIDESKKEVKITLGSGENVTCTFVNKEYADLKIVKNVEPGTDEQDFTFTPTGGLGANNNFVLDDNGSESTSGSGKRSYKEFDNIRAGIYTITEQPVAGWYVYSATCTGTNSEVLQGNTLTVPVESDDDIVCTFVNKKAVGNISGRKYEMHANQQFGSGLSGWKIFIDSDGDSNHDGGEPYDITDSNGSYEFNNLPAGNYRVCEELKAGWTTVMPETGNCYTTAVVQANNTTTVNFGNFKNGKIKGYKFHDINGNGNRDGHGIFAEPMIGNWKIYLYKDAGLVATTTTDNSGLDKGEYEFSNLAPGTYRVCEENLAGWQQIVPNPLTDECYTVVIDQSGETETRVFGNQAYATITVIKNVDNDGDGKVDEYNSEEWTWDYSSSLASGNDQITGTSKNVPTGSNGEWYRISEDQQPNFEMTGLTCEGAFWLNWFGDAKVYVNRGDNVTCTFTNTRKTGEIKVVKDLTPNDDLGRFNLNIDGQTKKYWAGDGGTTGYVRVPVGDYDVSETEANWYTDLSTYDTKYICYREGSLWPVEAGHGTSISEVEVKHNKKTTCYFFNKKKPKLIVIKDARPDSTQEFDFTIKKFKLFDYDLDEGFNLFGTDVVDEFTLVDDKPINFKNFHFNRFEPGFYIITEEDIPEGWTLDNIECYGAHEWRFGNSVKIHLEYGDVVTCVFTNDKDSEVVVTKYNDYNRNGEQDENEPTLPGWEINLGKDTKTTDENGQVVFENVNSYDWYYLSENQQEGWYMSEIRCEKRRPPTDLPTEIPSDNIDQQLVRTQQFVDNENSDGKWIYVKGDRTINCTVGNYREAVLELTKTNNRPNPTEVGDTVTYTLTAKLPETSGALFDVKVTDVVPENFEYVLGSASASQGSLAETYASPGTWDLGNMLPGDVITMVYRAVIQQNVSPGTYPDIAFAVGDDTPVEGTAVYSNVHFASTPFVGTDVTVAEEEVEPQVLGALVNTGSRLLALQFILPIIVIGAVVLLGRGQKKGAVR